MNWNPAIPASTVEGTRTRPLARMLGRCVRRTTFALIRAVERWTVALARAAWLTIETAALCGRAALKALACISAGFGAGLLTVGFFALEEPGQWDYVMLRQFGPPVAPVLIGGGVTILAADLLLLATFWRRPTGERRTR